jgi:two-component system, chemotaxis family, chemotaxis protein CheY
MAKQSTKTEPSVLIADDDQSIRQLVKTVVRRENIEVDCAVDGQDAVEKLQEREYALILLDLMMPRLDGFGVIEYLRTHPPSRKPVVLVITAYADQKFKDVDPDIVAGVLRKPFEIADLGNLIRLCVHGFDRATAAELLKASDRSIRDLAVRRWSAETTKDAGDGGN